MVVVFGSINLDLVSRVERFPAPGETLTGSAFATFPGGKGANQALAAARAGAHVSLYGAVGRDIFADRALELLAAGNVDLAGVARVDDATGCASILVEARGENCIVVVPGANALADPMRVPEAVLAPETVVVLQQEVPAAANEALIRRARHKGSRIVLNAAPETIPFKAPPWPGSRAWKLLLDTTVIDGVPARKPLKVGDMSESPPSSILVFEGMK